MAKSIKTRIQNKHDTEANWKLATTFVPLAGEVIIYDADSAHDRARVKIGDGETLVNALEFIDAEVEIPYSATLPVANGTASAGSASTVARSDHKHPTDTTRAAQADLAELRSDVENMITCGTADPSASTTSQFYFKYTT